MRWLFVSATNTSPLPSTATPWGLSSCSLPAAVHVVRNRPLPSNAWTRSLSRSVTKTFPAVSTATAVGSLKCPFPPPPLPQAMRNVPPSSNFWMRLLEVSATKTCPPPSTASPFGSLNCPLPVPLRGRNWRIRGSAAGERAGRGHLARGLVAHREQASREYEQAETEEVDRHEHGGDVSETAVADQPMSLVPAPHDVVGDQHQSLVGAVQDVLRLQAVPATHQAHRQHEGDPVRTLAVATEPAAARRVQHEAHVHVIAQPPGEAHVPAVPYLAEVAAQKRGVEVLRHADAEEMADADGERAVPGEVEEEVQAVGIHVPDDREDAGVARERRQRMTIDQDCEDELV